VPWIIKRKWGKRETCVPVGKGIFIQFLLSACGPEGRSRCGSHKGVSKSAVRFVLSALASRCSQTNLVCWPSIRMIAEDTGYTTNTDMEALDAASDQGWIRIGLLPPSKKRRPTGGAAPHQYQLMLPTFPRNDARRIIPGYVSHWWDTRITASTEQRLAQSDNALSDSVGQQGAASSY